MKSDRQLRQAIERDLGIDPVLAEFPISVDVKDGIATLAGRVRSLEERCRLNDVVERVHGLAGLVVDVETGPLALDGANAQKRNGQRVAPLQAEEQARVCSATGKAGPTKGERNLPAGSAGGPGKARGPGMR